jgi:Transposase IS116/IS110/IS902 family
MHSSVTKLDEQIAEIERRLRQWMKEDQAANAITAIPGVGVLTATAAVATMGNARAFRSGREFCRLDWTCAETDGLGWQGEPAGYQQTWRYVPAHAADSRRAQRAASREGTGSVGRADHQTTAGQCGNRGARQQDGENDLGDPGT